MKKMLKLLILLISIIPAISYSKTYEYYDHILNVSGFVNYTYRTTENIPHDNYNGAINVTLSNKYGYISSQFSTNDYNHVRRLMLDVPLYIHNNNQFEIVAGRLTHPIGFINTNVSNPSLNGSILLPVCTYDPRRYYNLPDIVDERSISELGSNPCSINAATIFICAS